MAKLKFAANLSFLYQDLPFLDRFAAAAKDGFQGVEYLFPYDWHENELISRLKDNGLSQVLFNVWPGDWHAGERGLASLKGREKAFRETLDQALGYADALGCKQLHIMAGLRDDGTSAAAQQQTYTENLAYAAEQCEKHEITGLIEPINIKDMPGYFLSSVSMAEAILTEINHPNLKLQFDMYHVQRTNGDICLQYKRAAPLIGHIQIANPPHRFEPDNGEINYPYIFDMLEKHGYDGWIGCEYKPSMATSETLGWAQAYLQR
ncbi:MAG: hydroxypyruvate isomerase [Sneathiella sp.]|nr:MAG: hydroxypyruvate isomerase [Sneathiella sp.]